MNAIEEARRLLNRANADLTALRNMSDVGIFDEGIFGFHAQQAVEKALKAWLAANNQTYPVMIWGIYLKPLPELAKKLRNIDISRN